MFGGFLQCEILNMQRKGAFPYMLNSISTWNLKDLKDLDVFLNLIHPRLLNFHNF
jgi:hypothetical protein